MFNKYYSNLFVSEINSYFFRTAHAHIGMRCRIVAARHSSLLLAVFKRKNFFAFVISRQSKLFVFVTPEDSTVTGPGAGRMRSAQYGRIQLLMGTPLYHTL